MTTTNDEQLIALIEKVDEQNNKSYEIINIARLHDISNLFYSKNYLIKIIPNGNKCSSEIWELKENPSEEHKLFKTNHTVISYGPKELIETSLKKIKNLYEKNASKSFNKKLLEQIKLNSSTIQTGYQPRLQ